MYVLAGMKHPALAILEEPDRLPEKMNIYYKTELLPGAEPCTLGSTA